MKKTLLIGLIIALCLCICACGNDKENASKPDGGSAQNQTPAHTCSGKEWVVKEEPSCVKDGTKEQLCDCGKVAATEPIPATGHSFLKGICEVCGAEDPDYVPGPSEGLVFVSQGDGTCYVTGIGTCTDTDLWIPETSPEGDTVVRIDSAAFMDNTCLNTVVIPAGVKRIHDDAFRACTQLKAVYGCEGLTAIGMRAFNGCVALAEIPFDIQLVQIQGGAFVNCASLKEVKLASTFNYLEGSAFSGCTGIVEVVIPEKVTHIEAHTFSGCTSLKKVVLGSKVVKIDDGAFRNCSSLDSIVLPETLSTMGAEIFKNCTSLKEIVIPAKVSWLGKEAFYGCESLAKVTINRATMLKHDSQFEHWRAFVILVPDDLVEEYKNHSAWGFYDIRKLSNPDVMLGSTGLEYTSNGDGTCYLSGIGTCDDMEVVIAEYSPAGDRVTKIGASAFEKCADIRKIVIPNSVTEIGAGAFMDCSRLESLEIPESVKVLGGSMIYGCHKLATLTIRSTTVLNYPEPPMHWEDNTYERMNVIYVPAELVEEYRNAYGWAPFGEKIQAIAE